MNIVKCPNHEKNIVLNINIIKEQFELLLIAFTFVVTFFTFKTSMFLKIGDKINRFRNTITYYVHIWLRK